MSATIDQLEDWSERLLTRFYDEHEVIAVGEEIYDSILEEPLDN